LDDDFIEETKMLLMLFACYNQIVLEYEAEKALLMQAPAPLEENWKPDMILRLNYGVISKLSIPHLQDNFTKSTSISKNILGATLKVTPEMTVKRLQIADAPENNQVTIRGAVEGKIPWKLGILEGTETCSASFQGKATVGMNDGAATLKMDSIELFRLHVDTLGGQDIAPLLEGWLQDSLIATKAITLSEFELSQTPIRGIRLNTTPTSTNIEMRSYTTHSGNILTPKLAMKPDWELYMHQETMLGWLRLAAFEQGIISNGMAVDPRDFNINDQVFELDVRLWKLEGRGKWWREYKTMGTIEKEENKLIFVGKATKGEDKSRGANLVDPLAFIAETMILDKVSDTLSYTLPAQAFTKVNQREWKVTIEQYTGAGNQIRLSGAIGTE